MNSGQANDGFNFRQFIGKEGESYYEIDREERHLAAILFHLLQTPVNRDALLKCSGCDWKIIPDEFGIYFEYAYLRDLWHTIDEEKDILKRNSQKRCAIIKMFKASGASDELLEKLGNELDVRKFNKLFIGKNPRADGKDPDLSSYIRSPGNWRLPALNDNLVENDCDMILACKIKWSFNAKPDLVIHTDDDHALCIELKLESEEGSYPSEGTEKRLLRERIPPLFGEGGKHAFPMKQTELQRFMMEEPLDLECRFLFVSRDGNWPNKKVSDDPPREKKLSWAA